VAELDHLREADGRVHIGALKRQAGVERWAGARLPLMAEALRAVGHAAIRNRGTVAGSVAHADPASELPALLLCLDGAAVARGAAGERVIPAGELFRAPLTTSLRPDELVTEVRFSVPRPDAGWGFAEVARRHGDFCSAWAARRYGAARRRRCSPIRRRAPSGFARPRVPPPRPCARMAISTPPRAIGARWRPCSRSAP